ncbi:MAG: tRNA pseudouridine(13) synthase TruD [Deltaproteobacteria bacterium]|jgi:tRNA pseudouridine13 synthase|nr:tRNA pseudouridine(13) synthase TruD [Deltaproteobacteria bacterium]
MARIRTQADDFRVEELPLYPPSGQGEHTFVRVEKRLVTTEEVASALARFAGVSARDVGYAGRKDRIAVATQWLSVPGLDPQRALDFQLEGVHALEATAHEHKLRTGQLRGNRFEIAVRGCDGEAREVARARLDQIARDGTANAFGSQRFGRSGRNAELGARLLRGELRLKDRRKARFAISALQSAVFNDVLDSRPTGIGELEFGDVAMLHASGGQFLVEDVEREQPRAAAFEISPTGPIFGNRAIEPAGEVAVREKAALDSRGISLADLRPPGGIRLRGARRALRVRPNNARMRDFSGGFWLDFELPPGSYATVLIRAVLGEEPEEGS